MRLLSSVRRLPWTRRGQCPSEARDGRGIAEGYGRGAMDDHATPGRLWHAGHCRMDVGAV